MITPLKPRSRAKFDVGVLFYNRARQTLDCVLSFLQEDIQPDIVILDQGSASEQRKLLLQGLSGHPNIRFVALAENIGVAAGRNRLCEACSAEWILFVDNDMALNTRGGVSLISSAVDNADGVPNHVLTIVYAQQDDDVGRSLQRILESCAHIIHFMWRADFRRLVGKAAVKRCAVLMELSETKILDRLCQSHITFSVCDHLFLGEEDIRS